MAGLWIGILANILGGSTYALQKLALDHGWTPGLLVFARLGLSLPFLWLTAPRGGMSAATPADKKRLVLIGVFGLAAPHLLGNYGLTGADSTSGAILIGMEPISIIVLARLFLGEPFGARQGIGVLSALIGATLVVSKGDLAALTELSGSTTATLLLALHGVLWSIYTVAAKPTLTRVSARSLVAVTSSIGVVAMIPFAIHDLGHIDLDRALEWRPIACVVYLALAVSWGGTVLWNSALSKISATLMASLIFIQPVTGMALGALLGEPLGPGTLVGAAFVFLGVWLGESKPAV